MGLVTPNNGVISVHFGAQVTTNLWNGRWYVITDTTVIEQLYSLSSYADHAAQEQTRHAIDIRDSYNIDVIGYPYRRNRSTRRVNTVSVNAPEVFTGPATAQVFDGAWVSGNAQVFDNAQIESRPIRSIDRSTYHTHQRHANIDQLLAEIPYDDDGVRRSYGIEYEIYSLTMAQESDLAYLLDTLPNHSTEEDGSLSSGGVEIVFDPLSKTDAIKTINTLNAFVRENNINMNGTGMHITYGVSNMSSRSSDITIRLNRLAYAIAAVGLKSNIETIFGRTFNNYACIPQGVIDRSRYNAFRVRDTNSWECRLIKWNCDINKIMDFFKLTESVFYRPFTIEDFNEIFSFLGSEMSGA